MKVHVLETGSLIAESSKGHGQVSAAVEPNGFGGGVLRVCVASRFVNVQWCPRNVAIDAGPGGAEVNTMGWHASNLSY